MTSLALTLSARQPALHLLSLFVCPTCTHPVQLFGRYHLWLVCTVCWYDLRALQVVKIVAFIASLFIQIQRLSYLSNEKVVVEQSREKIGMDGRDR